MKNSPYLDRPTRSVLEAALERVKAAVDAERVARHVLEQNQRAHVGAVSALSVKVNQLRHLIDGLADRDDGPEAKGAGGLDSGTQGRRTPPVPPAPTRGGGA